MVLEEATTSYGSSSGSESSSAPDGGDSGNEFRLHYAYDPNAYANVMPLVGQMMGYTAENRKRFNDSLLARVSELAERRLTDTEVNAISRTQYGATALMSWGTGLGVVGGVARAYQMRAQVTLPGLNMTKRFGSTYDKFWMLRGPMARLAWTSTRYVAYIQIGMLIGRWASASGAGMVSVNRFRTDPELKALKDVFTSAMQKRQQARREWAVAEMKKQANGGAVQGDDARDYSPQGNLGNDPDHSADTGVISDAQRVQREREAEAVSRREAQRSPQYPYRAPQRPQQTQLPTSSFDEDSPTGGTGLLDFDGPSQSSSSGSAWDRVRQQSASGGQYQAPTSASPRSFPSVQQQNAPARQYGRQTGQSPEDSFSFSNTEEERQLAKAEAQRAFDERVERERRGEDSNSREKTW